MGAFSAPHFGQRLDSGLPHAAQNFLPVCGELLILGKSVIRHTHGDSQNSRLFADFGVFSRHRLALNAQSNEMECRATSGCRKTPAHFTRIRGKQGIAATNVAAMPPKLRREKYPPGAQSPRPQVQIPGFMLNIDKLWISAHPALR